MRVFAGPNGSGKTTVIKSIRNYRHNNHPINFGFYINADDIARELREGEVDLKKFGLEIDDETFIEGALISGLIDPNGYSEDEFRKGFTLLGNRLNLTKDGSAERIAQITAHLIREALLFQNERFSFETVFSHQSKIDIMREAKDAGYKVYLYFVSTEDPRINVFRVDARVKQNGHHVDPGKIVSRYYRSLDLLFEACQYAYQAFFFDNSGDEANMFAHFKTVKGRMQWDAIDPKQVPQWFYKYYLDKIPVTKKKS